MTETPRTDAQKWRYFHDADDEDMFTGVDIDFARQLERELEIAEQALALMTDERNALMPQPCCQEFDTCERRCIPLIRHLREALALRGEPVAWALQNDQGYWTGIWQSSEMAESVMAKGMHNEKLIALYAAPISGERVREAQEADCWRQVLADPGLAMLILGEATNTDTYGLPREAVINNDVVRKYIMDAFIDALLLAAQPEGKKI